MVELADLAPQRLLVCEIPIRKLALAIVPRHLDQPGITPLLAREIFVLEAYASHRCINGVSRNAWQLEVAPLVFHVSYHLVSVLLLYSSMFFWPGLLDKLLVLSMKLVDLIHVHFLVFMIMNEAMFGVRCELRFKSRILLTLVSVFVFILLHHFFHLLTEFLLR